MLAGVGVTWYTWLEQGRPINASVQVLESIATTLRMDAQERWHLFELAGVTLVPPPREGAQPDMQVQGILDQLDPFPAVVLSNRYDILGYNRAYNQLGGNLDALEPGERNQLWLFFTSQHWKGMCLRRDQAAGHLVGAMRMAMTQHLDDPLWQSLVTRLREASTEFDTIWRRHDVIDSAMPAKDFRSVVGDLHLEATRMTIGHDGLSRLLVYSPRDAETATRLSQLVALDEVSRLQAG